MLNDRVRNSSRIRRLMIDHTQHTVRKTSLFHDRANSPIRPWTQLRTLQHDSIATRNGIQERTTPKNNRRIPRSDTEVNTIRFLEKKTCLTWSTKLWNSTQDVRGPASDISEILRRHGHIELREVLQSTSLFHHISADLIFAALENVGGLE
jgi:hypothetical protein